MTGVVTTGAGCEVAVDLLIIGAGPTGLYAAYYAGFRGMSVAVADALRPLHVNVNRVPLRPEALLDLIREAERSAADGSQREAGA